MAAPHGAVPCVSFPKRVAEIKPKALRDKVSAEPYITENPELEAAQKDHRVRVQILALHRTHQESHPVPESIDQKLSELCQTGAVATYLAKLFQCPIGNLCVSNLIPS
ncbi:hypothetical protein TURU_061288 [Turdus rufiventris]|nr:hypothetical protein TURU_061288 [Turdus rufiventris]